MYSELFDRLNRDGDANSGAPDPDSNEPKPLVSFKAGKMELQPVVEQPSTGTTTLTTSTTSSSSFQCIPIKTRGEVRLVWKQRSLQWQWYDRRDKQVVDSFVVSDDTDSTTSTFERIELPAKKHATDRIYVWTRRRRAGETTATPEESKSNSSEPAAAHVEYHMYWMQDAANEKDDEIVATVKQYLSDPQSARPEGEAPADTAERATSTSTTNTNQSQVDALSSILSNLGMPQQQQQQQQVSTTTTANGATAATSATTATLTLADLQGAMAGIQQQQQQQQQPMPSLVDILHPTALTTTSLLWQDDAVRDRLIALLPEEQRTADQLAENLRSPVVQQTLRALSATLAPDDDDDTRSTGERMYSGLYSVLANFQLDPEAAQAAIQAGKHPIQAFLDAVLQQVQKEQHAADDNEQVQEEEAAQDGDDGDGEDEPMDESKE